MLERLQRQRLEDKRDGRAVLLALTIAGTMGGGAFVFVMLRAAVDYLLGDEAFS